MIQKLLLIDLDGTARVTISGNICPESREDQRLRGDTAKTCSRLRANGWRIAGVTNQGGVEAINPETGNPYKTRSQAIKECEYFMDLAPWCEQIYMCPNKGNSDRDDVSIIRRN